MGAKLDRSRPYGTVHGSDTRACYEQDHKEFDNEGKEIVKAGKQPAHEAPVGKTDTVVVLTKDDNGNLSRDGQILDLEGMELAELHGLATAMGLELHPNLGAVKTKAAITEAAVAPDQLNQQLK